MKVLEIKEKYTLVDLCVGDAKSLFEFAEQVTNLDFESKPNYDHLEQILMCQIKDKSERDLGSIHCESTIVPSLENNNRNNVKINRFKSMSGVNKLRINMNK